MAGEYYGYKPLAFISYPFIISFNGVIRRIIKLSISIDFMEKTKLKKLSEHLGKYPVILAYLFGSEAKGKSGPLSDIEIALFIDKGISKSEQFDLRRRLSNELSSIMGVMVDLVILNDTPIQLSFEIIKNGKLISCGNKETKVDMEVEILSKYLDRRYYDKRHAELTLEKIAEGYLA